MQCENREQDAPFAVGRAIIHKEIKEQQCFEFIDQKLFAGRKAMIQGHCLSATKLSVACCTEQNVDGYFQQFNCMNT